MGSTVRFQPRPAPDSDVIELLERALDAARKGLIKTVIITGVNPLHECESKSAGDLGSINATVLIGGLSRAAHELLVKPPQ